jgi:cytochrome b6-f complex iron-sulfur subunit
MTLIDDLANQPDPKDLSRRKALGILGTGAIAAAMGGTAIVSVQYISPNVLYEADTRFKVGRPETIPPGTVVVLPKRKIYVVHGRDGFIALSAICTHLGCMTQHEPQQGRIFCPCHGSVYSIDGAVQGGPAPAPLPRLHLELDGGVLVVDTRRPAPPDAVLKA